MSMFKFFDYEIRGIKCDSCDWKDESVNKKDYHKFLNTPCPVCGENVLTKQDYTFTKYLIIFSNILNVVVFPYHITLYLFSKKYRMKFVIAKIEMDGKGKLEIKKVDE